MAKARSKKRREAGARSFVSRVTSEAAGLLLVGFSLIAAISLATYSSADRIFELGSVHNRIGPVGATLAGRQAAGELGPVLTVVAGLVQTAARTATDAGIFPNWSSAAD